MYGLRQAPHFYEEIGHRGARIEDWFSSKERYHWEQLRRDASWFLLSWYASCIFLCFQRTWRSHISEAALSCQMVDRTRKQRRTSAVGFKSIWSRRDATQAKASWYVWLLKAIVLRVVRHLSQRAVATVPQPAQQSLWTYEVRELRLWHAYRYWVLVRSYVSSCDRIDKWTQSKEQLTQTDGWPKRCLGIAKK